MTNRGITAVRSGPPPHAVGVFVGLQLAGCALAGLVGRLFHPPTFVVLGMFVAVPLVAVALVNIVAVWLGFPNDAQSADY